MIFKYTYTACTDQIENISLQGDDGVFIFGHPEVHIGYPADRYLDCGKANITLATTYGSTARFRLLNSSGIIV